MGIVSVIIMAVGILAGVVFMMGGGDVNVDIPGWMWLCIIPILILLAIFAFLWNYRPGDSGGSDNGGGGYDPDRPLPPLPRPGRSLPKPSGGKELPAGRYVGIAERKRMAMLETTKTHEEVFQPGRVKKEKEKVRK